MPPILPSNQRFPQPVPGTQRSYFYVDTRNATSDTYDRRGPYLCDHIPANGQLQVPSTNGKGEAIMVVIDERIWLPTETNVKARAVLLNVETNESYSVVHVERWTDRIEAQCVRRAPK